MNWSLIFQLSLFGLAMGLARVFVVPSNVEPLFWLVIFVICAYIIAARAGGQYFVHGLLVSVVNSVWITGTHVLLFDAYAAHHQREVEMMAQMPLSPRLMMLVTGPIVGVVSGLVLGLFAFIASRLVRRQALIR